jgi:hypothetical protein
MSHYNAFFVSNSYVTPEFQNLVSGRFVPQLCHVCFLRVQVSVELGIRVKDYVAIGTVLPFTVTVTSGTTTVGIQQNFTLTVFAQKPYTIMLKFCSFSNELKFFSNKKRCFN